MKKEHTSQLRKEYRRKDTFLRRWAAFYILIVLFLASWGAQFATQLEVEKQNAEQHGQAFQMSKFWPQFWQSTTENWQSEWLQLAAQALLIAGFSEYLFRKGDEEHYKTQLLIEELRDEVRALKK